jgi:hypothetical protein
MRSLRACNRPNHELGAGRSTRVTSSGTGRPTWGDHLIDGVVSVITDYKGPGKTRAVYERLLS